jgi:kumamolisin
MLLTMAYAVAPAGASTPARMAVPQGITPASVGAARVAAVSSGAKETVSFVLQERNVAALDAQIEAGMPHGFLSVAQFAARYGQPAAQIRALEGYLGRYGIASSADADGLDVTGTGSVGQFGRALSVTQAEYRTSAVPASDGQAARAAVTFRAAQGTPQLPSALAAVVQSVQGLDTYPVFTSNAVHTTAELRPATGSAVTPAAKGSVKQEGTLTPGNFAKQYGLTSLYAKGAKGQGQTLGIVTFASFRPSDATHFWSSVLRIKTKANRIKIVKIGAGSGAFKSANDSQETTLDVEQSGAVAPEASILVYEAPNTGVGGIDAYAKVASQNKAGTVSSSWGLSETAAQAGGFAGTIVRDHDEFFREMAAQGQSSFTSSGDSGAYPASMDLGSTNLSVQSTSDSPYTTAAGGTTAAGTIPLGSTSVVIKTERAWGEDWLWPHYRLFEAGGVPFTREAPFVLDNITGSTGGYSVLEGRPSYQKAIKGIGTFHAIRYLTPIDPRKFGRVKVPSKWTVWDAKSNTAAAPKPVAGSAKNGRVVPDISADADPYTGYLLYCSLLPGSHLEGGWGGTSFVAPQLNGAAAVINSYLHRRVGFWNPLIYKYAVSRTLTPFHPLDTTGSSNDNLYYTGTKGRVYNPGTGLGTPNLGKLATDFRKHPHG